MQDEKKNTIKLSVRNLVEFVMRGGDIDNRFASYDKDAMLAGSRLHRKLQKRMGGSYRAEVALRYVAKLEKYDLLIEGRADGVITEEGSCCIDEIKGLYKDILLLEEPFRVHKAQVMVYAFIYGTQNGLEKIDVQMTYCNLDNEDIKRFRDTFTVEWLAEWFDGLLREYKRWTDYQNAARIRRNVSIKGVEFPFEYREGQRELAVSVYKTTARGKTLFIQAPTGVGKTMSTVFPAVKAIGEGHGEKLFYLTAKTVTRTVAEEAFTILREQQGLYFCSVTITAKEKLCFCGLDCNPVGCEYAKGHYDRVNEAVFDIITHETAIDREKLLEYAEKHRVCPFEYCLDISCWADGIICDYNYVFDPNVRLKRYFAEGTEGEYIFLVDEAHNLVERAREMYSAELYKEDFLEIKRILIDKSKAAVKCIESCNRNLLEWKKQCVGEYQILPNLGAFAINLMRLSEAFEKLLEERREFECRREVTEFYFKVRFFLEIHELVDENYRMYTELTENGSFKIKLFCVHTAKNLQSCIDKAKSTIFFSATLLPVTYYKELLGCNRDAYAVYALSPFKQEKRLLAVARDVSSRYTRRNTDEYAKIFEYIRACAIARRGNYIVFFPSYKMLKDVYEYILTTVKDRAYDKNVQEEKNSFHIDDYGSTDTKEGVLTDGVKYVFQENGMTEGDREKFLEMFNTVKEYSLVALCVLGGVFSEGIDLKRESLIGVIVIGTGLPMICNEREILSRFYDEAYGRGFDYAYRFPGMNKVMQAAGRVIRTDDDEGVILLLDYRFLNRDYRNLFPREWQDYRETELAGVSGLLKNFWEDRDNAR